jgi:Rv0078B-related antitoxin
MTDTSAEAQAVQTRVLRAKTGAERMRLALEMSDFARALSMARIRCDHPGWSSREILGELIRETFLPEEAPEPLRRRR